MRVMISCGEPSGDLYAGALAREILSRRSVGVDHRLRQRTPARWRRRPGRRLQGLSVTGLLEVARVLPRTYADLPALVAHAAETRPDVFVADRLSRLQLPPRARDAPARRAGRLLHQPAALGLAAGPDEDDAAHCRSRAGHLSVRGRDLPSGRRCQSSGSAIRCSTCRRCRKPRDTFLCWPAAGSVEAGGCAAARQPDQRGARDPSGLLDAARIIRARLPAAQFVLARAPHLPTSSFAASPMAMPPIVDRSTRRPTTCWRRQTSRCSRRAR